MPDDRLERTRAAYRCGRSFVIMPWRHCDCRGCTNARWIAQHYADPLPVTTAWYMDPNLRAMDPKLVADPRALQRELNRLNFEKTERLWPS